MNLLHFTETSKKLLVHVFTYDNTMYYIHFVLLMPSKINLQKLTLFAELLYFEIC